MDENQVVESVEKVFVVQETVETLSGDAIVCFCAPGFESGYGWFDYIKERAGNELKDAVKRFSHISLGSTRITSSFNLQNFKAIVFVVVPEIFLIDENPLEASLMKLICKNAVDIAVESEYHNIVFPAIINQTSLEVLAPEIMKCFREYVNETPYCDELGEVKIVCTDEESYRYFYQPVPVPKKSFKKIKQDVTDFGENEPEEEYTTSGKPKRRRKNYSSIPIPADDVEHMKSNGMYLMLSAKLEPTILNLKDENGYKRQYRMTNRSSDGRKLYFRCSRCDTLSKKNTDAIRARLIISNGEIVGEEFPQHHPECQPWTHEQLLVQQIDRSSRKTVKEGLLQPFEAYQDALSRISHVATQHDTKVIEVPRFPEWNHIRGQPKRRRKQEIEESQMYEVGYIEAEEGQEGEYVEGEEAAIDDISVTD